ncbi:MAG: hypothetical protein H0X15_15510 [Acidobacteria bacterium]|nr:hypothetical protein [Acidobacteriota bacterium]MBA4185375.1 hypothetical protein [Acidobacteriota bacterium]
MQTNLEQVTKIIRTLPLEDFNKVREVLDEEEQERKRIETDKKIGLEQRIEKFKKAEKWLSKNREKYMNQWVCLEGARLVAHGTDALEVHRKAKEAGIEIPFMEHIVDESLPFGGW